MLSMSEARGSPEKKRRHNHECPERSKQQEEIVCGHVRIPRWVCDRVGPSAARVAHIAISDVAIATGSPARNLQGAGVHTEASLGMVRLIATRSAKRWVTPSILSVSPSTTRTD